jgi:hypothetical protein
MSLGRHTAPFARILRTTIFCIGFGAGCARPVALPDSMHPSPSALSAVVDSSIVPALTLVGVVVEGEEGRAFDSARVWLYDAHHVDPTHVLAQTMTDSSGHFTITAPHAGLLTIVIQRLGYQVIRGDVQFGLGYGLQGTFRTYAREVVLSPTASLMARPHPVLLR